MIAKFIYLGILTLGLGMSIANHGKKRRKHNGWASLIAYTIQLILLYFCGMFDSF